MIGFSGKPKAYPTPPFATIEAERDALKVQVAALSTEVTRLRAVISEGPTPMDKLITSLTKIIAGPEASLAIGVLVAIGKIMKDVKAGANPDFRTLATIVHGALPAAVAVKATEEELALLANTGLAFAKAVSALF